LEPEKRSNPQSQASRVLPLGRESRKGVLRAPHSWPTNTPWPPSVKAARRALEGTSRSKRKEGGVRGRMRSARDLFTYAGALAQRALKEPWRRGDLIEGFSIFIEIAESKNAHHFGRYRAPALYNATALVMELPARPAISLAARLARTAIQAVEEAFRAEVESQFMALHNAIVLRALSYHQPAALAWEGSVLVPVCPLGEERVGELPEVGFRGTYVGVAGLLSDYGLVSPAESPYRVPINAQPKGASIVISPV
jgi:hypothetical protein